MKKSTLESIVALVNDRSVEDMDTLREEVNAEYDRITAKARANANAYAAAKDVILGVMSPTDGLTAKDIYTMCVNDLPENFSASKVQYGLRNYWTDEVEAHDNGRNAALYTLRNGEESTD